MTRRFVVRLILSLAVSAAVFGTAAAQDERFYIVGYVKRPGSYKWKADITVGEAIDLAGGFAPNRTVTEIVIIRKVDGEDQRSAVSLADPVSAGDTISLK